MGEEYVYLMEEKRRVEALRQQRIVEELALKQRRLKDEAYVKSLENQIAAMIADNSSRDKVEEQAVLAPPPVSASTPRTEVRQVAREVAKHGPIEEDVAGPSKKPKLALLEPVFKVFLFDY